MADHLTNHLTFLDEVDTRQNDVLRQLDELNHRIELLLDEFTKPAAAEAQGPVEKAA